MSILVVLCGGKPSVSSGVVDVGDETESKDGVLFYVGGTLRLDAAVALSHSYQRVLVVGGSRDKVDAMRRYMTDNGCPAGKICALVTDPETTGNLWAIHEAIKMRMCVFSAWVDGSPLHVITNAYHQLRTLRFAADILGDKAHVVPLVAEAFVGSPEEHARVMTSPECGYVDRMLSEFNGLAQWERGEYGKQKQTSGWRCEPWNCTCNVPAAGANES